MFLNDGDIGDSNLSCHGVIMRGGTAPDRGHTQLIKTQYSLILHGRGEVSGSIELTMKYFAQFGFIEEFCNFTNLPQLHFGCSFKV